MIPMRRFVRKALGRIGFDVRPLRDVSDRLIGVEILLGGTRRGAARGEVVTASIEGQPIQFFVVNEADVIQRDHKLGRFYEESGLKLISDHYKGGVFVDIGANIGNHAIFAGRMLKAPKIIAIEPNPEAYTILNINLALNDLARITTHHAVGLSDAPGWATCHTPVNNLGGTSLNVSSDTGKFPIVVGDELLDHEQVGFIKIDTEGMEIAVLRGLARTVQRTRPPIFVEVDDENLPEFNRLLDDWNYGVRARYRQYGRYENFLIEPLT